LGKYGHDMPTFLNLLSLSVLYSAELAFEAACAALQGGISVVSSPFVTLFVNEKNEKIYRLETPFKYKLFSK
jgi:hypothetical protein